MKSFITCDNCGGKIEDKNADNYCPYCKRKNGSVKIGKKSLKELGFDV